MNSLKANNAPPATKPNVGNEPVAMAAAPDEDEEVAVAVLVPEDEEVDVPEVLVFFPVLEEEDDILESAEEVVADEDPAVDEDPDIY